MPPEYNLSGGEGIDEKHFFTVGEKHRSSSASNIVRVDAISDGYAAQPDDR